MTRLSIFTAAMGVCDPSLEGHASRVGVHAEVVARRLGWTGTALEELRLGEALHDVGKVNVRPDVLSKPGLLDDDELAEVRAHPVEGAWLIAAVPSLSAALPYVLFHESLKAAGELADEGISVEVWDPRTLLPLDEESLVTSVEKTHRCVVAHEAVTRMGWGAEVAAIVQERAFDELDTPIQRVGSKFAPLPFSPVMEQYVVPHQADVVAAIRRTVERT